MSKTTYPDAEQPRRCLLETGKNAAYFALRGWDVSLTPMDREDLGQVAAAEYWETLERTNYNDRIAWYSAQRRVRRYYDRVLTGNNPYADSLDVPAYEEDNRPPPTRLQLLPSDGPDDHGAECWPSARWLPEDDLVKLVHELHQYRRPTRPALRRLAQILRLLCEGYDNAAIGVDTSHITWGLGGWRRAHDFGLSGQRKGRRQGGAVAAGPA